MTVIVQNITRLMVPSIFILGAYVIVHGHLTPGGGFAGGVLLVGCFLLQILAFGSSETQNNLRKWRTSLTESIGLCFFLFVALLGFIQGGLFFTNVLAKSNPGIPYHLFSGGLIPLSNIAIGVEVSAALLAIFTALTIFKTGRKM